MVSAPRIIFQFVPHPRAPSLGGLSAKLTGLLQVCYCIKFCTNLLPACHCEQRSDAAIRSPFVRTLGRRKYLVRPPAGSFSSRGKGTKGRFFMSGLHGVGAGEGAATRKPLRRSLACTGFGASARRDDIRACPGSCAPRGASSVPAAAISRPLCAPSGDRKGCPDG